MITILVLLPICSMFVTHISCFIWVLRRSFVFLDLSHRTSAGVSLSLCGRGGEESAPGSLDDQLVLRNCFVWLSISVVSSCVIFCQSLMRCWTSSTRGHPQHVFPLLRQPIQVGKILTRASLDEEYAQSVLSRWKWAMQLMSWLRSLWPVLPTLPQNWVSLTARYAKKTCLYSPWQFRGTTVFPRDPALREGSSPPSWDSWVACPWFRRQASDWRWAGEAVGKDFAGSFSCSGQRTPVPRRLDSGCFRKHWPQLPVLAKVSSLIDVLQLSGSYKLVQGLWERFVLTASRVNVSVARSRNEVLVSSVYPPEHLCRLLVTCLIIQLL